MMVLSWAMVGVIRSSFYLSALLMKVIPYPIFYARYSAFAILYPTGIAGERGTAYAALQQPELAAYHAIIRFILYLFYTTWIYQQIMPLLCPQLQSD